MCEYPHKVIVNLLSVNGDNIIGHAEKGFPYHLVKPPLNLFFAYFLAIFPLILFSSPELSRSILRFALFDLGQIVEHELVFTGLIIVFMVVKTTNNFTAIKWIVAYTEFKGFNFTASILFQRLKHVLGINHLHDYIVRHVKTILAGLEFLSTVSLNKTDIILSGFIILVGNQG